MTFAIESSNANNYIFPDANTTESAISPLANTINSTQNASSNGSNVASASVDSNNNTGINVSLQRSSGYQTVVSQDLPETVVTPKMPANLSIAEQALFTRRYPPLPSTDNRVLSSPYV